jgi:hypothetical protein
LSTRNPREFDNYLFTGQVGGQRRREIKKREVQPKMLLGCGEEIISSGSNGVAILAGFLFFVVLVAGPKS